MNRKKIIIDCDPGQDDAVAIMVAGKNPTLEILGITVVAGNQTLDKTQKNALSIVDYLGLDLPVYAGCTRPMVRDRITAADIHGESGLAGHTFGPCKKQLEKQHAVQFIIDTLLHAEAPITLVPIGPLTNIAMAMRLEPKIIDKIERIVLMGGSYGLGNVTPAAEFNIFADGDAAHVCFTSGVPITMVGLDVTRQALCNSKIIERMSKIQNKATALFLDLMNHYCKVQKEIFNLDGGALHDPVVAAYLIDPSILVTKPMNVEIDIRGTQSYGRTNCDYFSYLKKEPTADVAVEIDVEKFWDIVEQEFHRYDRT